MTPETALLILRLAGGLLLLAFVGALFFLIRRDMALTTVQVAARQHPHGRLAVVSVEEEVPLDVGTAFPLLPITTFGRAPTNTVQLQDSFASARHALLTLRTGRWWLEDAGSRNGTTLNGQLLEEPTVVSAGDVIGVGRVEFRVELE